MIQEREFWKEKAKHRECQKIQDDDCGRSEDNKGGQCTWKLLCS